MRPAHLHQVEALILFACRPRQLFKCFLFFFSVSVRWNAAGRINCLSLLWSTGTTEFESSTSDSVWKEPAKRRAFPDCHAKLTRLVAMISEIPSLHLFFSSPFPFPMKAPQSEPFSSQDSRPGLAPSLSEPDRWLSEQNILHLPLLSFCPSVLSSFWNGACVGF
jgi:hypothetical protein